MSRLRFTPPRTSALREHEPLLMVLGAALVVYVITLQNGHVWGDDFAQYIMHAKNLWRGAPYAETGYLQNPVDTEALLVGPKAYPPLAPALFAPIYAAFGLDYRLLKFVQALELCLALGAVWALLRQYAPAWITTTVVALVAFHPWTLSAKEMIGSDVLFFGLCFGTLALIEYVARARTHSIPLWLLVGAMTYLACATRTVGLALLPVPVVLTHLRTRRAVPASLLAVVVPAVLIAVQRAWLPTDQSYIRMLEVLSPAVIVGNVIAYAAEVSAIFANGLDRATALGVLLIALPFIVRGAWEGLRQWRALELFLVAYVGIVILWPATGGARFLLPLLPALLFYLLDGVRLLLPMEQRAWRYAIVGVIGASEVSHVVVEGTRRVPAEATRPDFLAFAAFAQRYTRPGDVFLFRKPRLFALLTGREATVFNHAGNDAQHWALIDSLGVRYVGIATLPHEDFNADTAVVRPFLQRHASSFDLVYRGGAFRLYRVNSPSPSRLQAPVDARQATVSGAGASMPMRFFTR